MTRSIFLVVLLVMDKVKGGTRAFKTARGLTREPVWGADRPLGFLFPKQWAMIWVGYWLVRVPHSRTPSADTQGRSTSPACIDGVRAAAPPFFCACRCSSSPASSSR